MIQYYKCKLLLLMASASNFENRRFGHFCSGIGVNSSSYKILLLESILFGVIEDRTKR